jgi:hypothetical protein
LFKNGELVDELTRVRDGLLGQLTWVRTVGVGDGSADLRKAKEGLTCVRWGGWWSS